MFSVVQQLGEHTYERWALTKVQGATPYMECIWFLELNYQILLIRVITQAFVTMKGLIIFQRFFIRSSFQHNITFDI